MTNPDLNAMSLRDLKQFQKDLVKAVSDFDGRRKSETRAALEARAKKLGFSLAGIFGSTVGITRAAASPKYRHPENAPVTWSGRGRKPHWFIDALAAGKTEEALAV